jgi:predicted nucleic acid-binding protein
MNGKAFLDTNIFVYTFDAREPAKQDRARQLVGQALSHQQGITSFQVIQEFLNVATRKFVQPLSHADCRDYLEHVLAPLCEVFASIELYRLALDTAERWHYAFYDSLIIAAAVQAGCRGLYSEDLQHGQRIGSLTITNPFVLS